MDRATPNLPSADLDRTAAFYGALGFSVGFKDDGWMILERGPVTLEFFPLPVDPRTTFGSACVRVDDLDSLRAAFGAVPRLSEFCRWTPGVLPIREADGLRMFVLIDPDGNLLRCIDNRYAGSS
jgi:catechol 2,3-dioxygenase-like lactoylglutathione lyase family enzyme